MFSDVVVSIERKRPVTGKEGWIPLLFAGGLEAEVPYTECFGMEAVQELFGKDSELARMAALLWRQEAAPDKIAVLGATGTACAALPAVLDKPWRQLLLCGEEPLEEVAQMVQQAEGKVLFAGVKTVAEAEGPGLYERLFLLLDPEETGYAAAVLGATAGRKAGSFTYKNLLLAGVPTLKMSGEELAAAHRAGCVCVVEKAGDTVTSEGKVASGEYLDVLDARDFLVGEIQYRTQKLLNQEEKIPYDNNGIALLESVCVNVLAGGYAAGMIAEKEDGSGDYTVAYAPRNATLPEDREKRHYAEGKFSFALAGAVHSARVYGTIVV